MARSFEDYMEALSPPWLLSGRGARFMRAIGQVKDGSTWRMLQALMGRYPGYATASAVGMLGAERGIDKGPGESLASYAGRVRGAWDTRAYGGTARGMLTALYVAGYTEVRLATAGGRIYWMNADRDVEWYVLPEGSWLFGETDSDYWSRFIVIFPEPLPADWVANGVPAESSDEAKTIKRIVRRWKPAHMDTAAIIIASSPETFDYFPEGGTWDNPGATWGDETTWTTWSP